MVRQVGKILSKAPCNADLFEGNAHQRLAEIIADEILHDDKCTIIGIEGSWGSGKSNLVGMIQEILSDPTKQELYGKYYFFTFDAWGHQNDLPRRSILEELTSFLTEGDKPILKEEKWKEQLKDLLAKKKFTSTKTVPRVNFAIITIALLVAFTPVLASVANFIPNSVWRLVITGVFYFLAISFIVWKQIRNMKKYGQKIDCESFFTELFLLYKDQIKEDERFETTSEREPSTKQFKNWVSDINTDLGKGRYLVIVIDNMDRLPKIKVQELWSAIHSFFSEEKYSNIRVIVPFDRAHIQNAFQSEDIISGAAGHEEMAVYGDDFINKTFYIVYHVAPPILSDWKGYFECQWKAAFGDDTIVDNAVLQVYDLLTKEHTPRKIMAFVNEFVTIKNISSENIPDKYIALYIFGRSAITKNPISEILKPTYLGTLDFLYGDDQEMPKYISALHYQLPVDAAVDVIYTGQFTRELDENQLDSIVNMKESGIRKFNAIFERALANVSNTSNATLAMHSLFSGEDSTAVRNFWECLYQKDKVLRGDITEYSDYHKFLLSHISNKSEYWKDLIRGYHSAMYDGTDMLGYIHGIDELAEVTEVDTYGRLKKVAKEITPKQFVELVSIGGNNYRRYGVICKDAQLSDYLASLELSDWDKLTILPFLNKKNYPLVSFLKAVETKLSVDELEASTAKILFARLKELKTDKINYSDYFNDDTLDELFTFADEDFEADLLAMRLSRQNYYNGSYRNSFDDVLDEPEDKIVDAVAKVCHHYISYGDLLLGLEGFSNILAQKVCRYLTINRCGTQRMSILAVAKKFDVIINESDITEDELFVRMNDWSEYKGSIKLQMVPSIPMSFYEAAKRNECELSNYVLELIMGYLDGISQDDWMDYLKNNDCAQMQLLKLHHPKQLPSMFNAFKAIMKGYAIGDVATPLLKTEVDELLQILVELKHKISRLFIDIRDFYLSASITKNKLLYFGKWIFKYGNVAQKAGCLEKLLPTEMLDDQDIIELMAENKEAVKGMIEKSEDPSDFISTMQSMLEGNQSGNDDFKSLCRFMDIQAMEKE